jgi:hypothetical protein
MKYLRNFLVLFAVAISATSAFGQADEKEAVKVPLNNYIQGHATGNGEFFKKAFHTEGNMLWMREGKFTSRSFTEYIAGASGKPAADEADRKRAIESIDVAGTAASARIVLDYPTVRFVDYMTLLKIDGEWKIVSKVFFAEPKAKK